MLNSFLLSVILWVPYSFKMWIAVVKGKEFLQVIAINGRITLKYILMN